MDKEDNFIFSTNGSLDSITHNAGTAGFVIQKTGRYLISFVISTSEVDSGNVGLAVDGVVATGTTTQLAVETVGQAILDLDTGDEVTLRNIDGVGVDMVTSPAIAITINFVQLDIVQD
jgi:hypothetical protein